MREIKFRARFEDAWEYTEKGNLEHFWGMVELGRYTDLCQYTGLKDKNGREIYEGDIIQSHHFVKLFVVRWKGRGFMFSPLKSASTMECNLPAVYYTVIGNIWENPALVEENAPNGI